MTKNRWSPVGLDVAIMIIMAVALLPLLSQAAPLQDVMEIQQYKEGCYYNYNHYGEGDRIMTNEPCLNCTCHNKMLMCYLRVCPFTKPIGHDCIVEKREDQCCPIITCPEVPVDISHHVPEPGTELSIPEKFGCSIDDKFYPEGAQVPSNPNKPCELCYCIKNRTSCLMQECTLHIDGCTPIYNKGSCCPVRYNCDHENDVLGLEDKSSTTTTTTTERPTPGFILTTTMTPSVSTDCVHDGEVYADGASIIGRSACEHCYCMRGDIVCAVQECEMLMLSGNGKSCRALPPSEGECCASNYVCEDEVATTEVIQEITTKPYPITTTPTQHQGIHDTISDEDLQLQAHIDDEEDDTHSSTAIIPSDTDNVRNESTADEIGSGDLSTERIEDAGRMTTSAPYMTTESDLSESTTMKSLVEDKNEADEIVQPTENISSQSIYSDGFTTTTATEMDKMEQVVSEIEEGIATTISIPSDETESHNEITLATNLTEEIESVTTGKIEDKIFKADNHTTESDITDQQRIETTTYSTSKYEIGHTKLPGKDIEVHPTSTIIPDDMLETTSSESLETDIIDKTIVSTEKELPKPQGTEESVKHEIDISDMESTTPSDSGLDFDISSTETTIKKDNIDDTADLGTTIQPSTSVPNLPEAIPQGKPSSNEIPESESSVDISQFDTSTKASELPHDTSILGMELPSVIPGEGDCLVDRKTYANNSNVPTSDECEVSCECISSIILCKRVECKSPENLDNCVINEYNTNKCCPTYKCADNSDIETGSEYEVSVANSGPEDSKTDIEEVITLLPTSLHNSELESTTPITLPSDIIIPSVSTEQPMSHIRDNGETTLSNDLLSTSTESQIDFDLALIGDDTDKKPIDTTDLFVEETTKLLEDELGQLNITTKKPSETIELTTEVYHGQIDEDRQIPEDVGSQESNSDQYTDSPIMGQTIKPNEIVPLLIDENTLSENDDISVEKTTPVSKNDEELYTTNKPTDIDVEKQIILDTQKLTDTVAPSMESETEEHTTVISEKGDKLYETTELSLGDNNKEEDIKKTTEFVPSLIEMHTEVSEEDLDEFTSTYNPLQIDKQPIDDTNRQKEQSTEDEKELSTTSSPLDIYEEKETIPETKKPIEDILPMVEQTSKPSNKEIQLTSTIKPLGDIVEQTTESSDEEEENKLYSTTKPTYDVAEPKPGKDTKKPDEIVTLLVQPSSEIDNAEDLSTNTEPSIVHDEKKPIDDTKKPAENISTIVQEITDSSEEEENDLSSTTEPSDAINEVTSIDDIKKPFQFASTISEQTTEISNEADNKLSGTIEPLGGDVEQKPDEIVPSSVEYTTNSEKEEVLSSTSRPTDAHNKEEPIEYTKKPSEVPSLVVQHSKETSVDETELPGTIKPLEDVTELITESSKEEEYIFSITPETMADVDEKKPITDSEKSEEIIPFVQDISTSTQPSDIHIEEKPIYDSKVPAEDISFVEQTTHSENEEDMSSSTQTSHVHDEKIPIDDTKKPAENISTIVQEITDSSEEEEIELSSMTEPSDAINEVTSIDDTKKPVQFASTISEQTTDISNETDENLSGTIEPLGGDVEQNPDEIVPSSVEYTTNSEKDEVLSSTFRPSDAHDEEEPFEYTKKPSEVSSLVVQNSKETSVDETELPGTIKPLEDVTELITESSKEEEYIFSITPETMADVDEKKPITDSEKSEEIIPFVQDISTSTQPSDIHIEEKPIYDSKVPAEDISFVEQTTHSKNEENMSTTTQPSTIQDVQQIADSSEKEKNDLSSTTEPLDVSDDVTPINDSKKAVEFAPTISDQTTEISNEAEDKFPSAVDVEQTTDSEKEEELSSTSRPLDAIDENEPIEDTKKPSEVAPSFVELSTETSEEETELPSNIKPLGAIPEQNAVDVKKPGGGVVSYVEENTTTYANEYDLSTTPRPSNVHTADKPIDGTKKPTEGTSLIIEQMIPSSEEEEDKLSATTKTPGLGADEEPIEDTRKPADILPSSSDEITETSEEEQIDIVKQKPEEIVPSSIEETTTDSEMNGVLSTTPPPSDIVVEEKPIETQNLAEFVPSATETPAKEDVLSTTIKTSGDAIDQKISEGPKRPEEFLPSFAEETTTDFEKERDFTTTYRPSQVHGEKKPIGDTQIPDDEVVSSFYEESTETSEEEKLSSFDEQTTSESEMFTTSRPSNAIDGKEEIEDIKKPSEVTMSIVEHTTEISDEEAEKLNNIFKPIEDTKTQTELTLTEFDIQEGTTPTTVLDQKLEVTTDHSEKIEIEITTDSSVKDQENEDLPEATYDQTVDPLVIGNQEGMPYATTSTPIVDRKDESDKSPTTDVEEKYEIPEKSTDSSETTTEQHELAIDVQPQTISPIIIGQKEDSSDKTVNNMVEEADIQPTKKTDSKLEGTTEEGVSDMESLDDTTIQPSAITQHSTRRPIITGFDSVEDSSEDSVESEEEITLDQMVQHIGEFVTDRNEEGDAEQDRDSEQNTTILPSSDVLTSKPQISEIITEPTDADITDQISTEKTDPHSIKDSEEDHKDDLISATLHPLFSPQMTTKPESLDSRFDITNATEEVEKQSTTDESLLSTTTSTPSTSTTSTTEEPVTTAVPSTYQTPTPMYGQPPQYPSYSEDEYTDEDETEVFGPGTCRYGGKLYVSAQQIPRDDPCDFCFCFRSDIICLQQSCPPPISGCHEEPISGFCCPRYECPVSMANVLNITTSTTTTSTTLPPHFLHHSYGGAVQRNGCQINGRSYKVGEKIESTSGPCINCTCGGDGKMKCDPQACVPEPTMQQVMAVVASGRKR